MAQINQGAINQAMAGQNLGEQYALSDAVRSNAFIPLMGDYMNGMGDQNFDAGTLGLSLGEGVRAFTTRRGVMFGKVNPNWQGDISNYSTLPWSLKANEQRVDMQGNPFKNLTYGMKGTVLSDDLKAHFGGVGNFSPQGQVSGFSPGALQWIQTEASKYGSGFPAGDAFRLALNNYNYITGNQAANRANLAASQAQLRENAKKSRSFGNRLKKFAGVAAPVLLAPLTAGLSSALAGSIGAAGATGVAAGGAASAGFGSSLLSNFATNAALSGAITGGLGGLASGGDFNSALKGAAFGGLGGGFGNAIGGGLGLGSVGQQAFTSGLTGAAGGLGSGNMRDALLGGAMGAGFGYLSAGGNVPGLGSFQQQLPSDFIGAPNQGTGLIGNAQNALQGATNTGLSIGGQPMKLGSLLSAGGDVYGYMQGKDDLDDIQNTLMQQSQAAQAQLNPYAQAGQTALGNLQAPSMEALQNDPGYQFQLQEGNQALERSLAAQGMGQSGAAMKAAQRYGQGLASQSYNDYFNRQNSIANRGYGAAQGLGSIMQSQGDVQAAAQMQGINNRNSFLSSLLGGGTNDDGDYLQGSLGRLLGGLGGGNQGGQFYNGQRINWN